MAIPPTVFIGDIFGRLTVLEWDKTKGSWLCLCECGKRVYQSTSHLRAGNVMSCGCYREECNVYKGKTNTPEYSSFVSMHKRAGDLVVEGSKTKLQYYDQGIRVCERWSFSPDGFKNFVQDLGQRPDGHTLERKDGSLGYTPENCIWETTGKQAFNRKVFSNSKSGCTGVVFDQSKNKWVAYINKEGKRTNLGTFEDKGSAVEARRLAEEMLYPDKAEEYWKIREE